MKKRLLSILLVASMVVAMVPAMVFATSAETSITDWTADEIVLMTKDDYLAFHAQLVAGNRFIGQTVKLGADINLGGVTLAQIGNAVTSPNGFRGTLDGQFHTLENFKTAAQYSNGFLGNLYEADPDVHVQIKNLRVLNYTNTVSKRVGAFYGQVGVKLTFENVYLNAYINGTSGGNAEYAGGYIGNVIDAADVKFNNCVFDGSVAFASNSNGGSAFVGAVGHKDSASGHYDRPDNKLVFTNCLATGTFYYASAGSSTYVSCRFVGVWGAGENEAATKDKPSNKDINPDLYEYNNCIQWSETHQNNSGSHKAVCEELTGMWPGDDIELVRSKLPEDGSFTARSTSYPIPTALMPFYTADFIDWEAKTITLTNADDFKAFHNKLIEGEKFLGKTVKLGADIDLGGATLGALGAVDTSNNTTFSNGKGFYGTFDGQFHTLSNLKLASNVTNAGLFGSLSSKARGDATAESFEANVQIKNLKVENLSATGLKRYGLFYGDVNVPVSFENVYMNATTTSGKHMGGGFVGNALKHAVMSFTNCVFDGNLNYGWYMGSGFVGALGDNHTAPTTKPVFTNCVVSGTFQNGTETVGGGAHYIGNKRDDATAGTFTNCIQYTDYRQTGNGAASALCPTLTNIGSGLTAKTPEGFTARNTSYPVPTTLLPFFTDEINAAHETQAGGENALTVEYSTAQKKAENSEWNVRLIGALNVADEAALANYKAVGFEIVAVSQNTGEVMNVGATNIYDVYTSYLENDATITAAEAGGTYVFMLALEDIPMDKGIATFAIKTYYTDANGATVYTDMYVLNFNTAAPAAA